MVWKVQLWEIVGAMKNCGEAKGKKAEGAKGRWAECAQKGWDNVPGNPLRGSGASNIRPPCPTRCLL